MDDNDKIKNNVSCSELEQCTVKVSALTRFSLFFFIYRNFMKGKIQTFFRAMLGVLFNFI